MATGAAGTVGYQGRRERWLHALASTAVGIGFLALWFWLLPNWLGFDWTATQWRWIAAVPSVLGFAVALICIWDFGWTGQGTPALVAPPKQLVVVGFYRYVRNPMYLGFFTGWAGLWVIFGRANLPAVLVAVVAALGVALFVRLYEEPVLREKFGVAYDEYRRNVPRWLPRLRPWSGGSSSSHRPGFR